MRLFAMCLAFCFIFQIASAQFRPNGDFKANNGLCYQMTAEEALQSSTMWAFSKISLAEKFDTTLQVFLGCKDEGGGDGIVFAFQNLGLSLGNYDGHLAFEKLRPIIGIEIDTHENPEHNDPDFDHVAIFQNGTSDHQSIDHLAGPVQALATNSNIEDCQYHDLRVRWDPGDLELSFYLDCELRLSVVKNLVDSLFNGNPEVYWGFTAGTGLVNNVQEVCLNEISYLGLMEDLSICAGTEVELKAPIEGLTYQWSPAQGLSADQIPNPIATPDHSTSYRVLIKDACGKLFEDSLHISVRAEDVLVDLGPTDTLLCENQSLNLNVANPNATYRWSTGSTAAEISVTEPGDYSLTLTSDNCRFFDQIKVETFSSTTLNLGADTILCEGQSLLLAPKLSGTNFLWQDGSTKPSYLVKEAGQYSLSLSSNCGVLESSIWVDYQDCKVRFYVPNAFSPNGDGVNDQFLIQSSTSNNTGLKMKIFNRWGALVFDSNQNNSEPSWDGTSSSQDLPAGHYFYVIEVEKENGDQELLKGLILLIR